MFNMSSETYEEENGLTVHKEEYSKGLFIVKEDQNKHLETHNNVIEFNEDKTECSGSIHVQTNEVLNSEHHKYDGVQLTQSAEIFVTVRQRGKRTTADPEQDMDLLNCTTEESVSEQKRSNHVEVSFFPKLQLTSEKIRQKYKKLRCVKSSKELENIRKSKCLTSLRQRKAISLCSARKSAQTSDTFWFLEHGMKINGFLVAIVRKDIQGNRD